MKKLVSWYKKKDKELETHFTAGLLQINFVTNALILLAFTSILSLASRSMLYRIDLFNLVFLPYWPLRWRFYPMV